MVLDSMKRFKNYLTLQTLVDFEISKKIDILNGENSDKLKIPKNYEFYGYESGNN